MAEAIDEILKELEEIKETNFSRWAEHELDHKNINYTIKQLMNDFDRHLRDGDKEFRARLTNLECKVASLSDVVMNMNSDIKGLGTQLEFIVEYVKDEMDIKLNPKTKRDFWFKIIGVIMLVVTTTGGSLGFGINWMGNKWKTTNDALNDKVIMFKSEMVKDLESMRSDIDDVKEDVKVIRTYLIEKKRR